MSTFPRLDGETPSEFAHVSRKTTEFIDSSRIRNGDERNTCCSLQVTEDGHVFPESRRKHHPVGSWLLLPIMAIPAVLLLISVLASAGRNKAARSDDLLSVTIPRRLYADVVGGDQWTELFVEVNGINVSYYQSIAPVAGLPKLVYYHGGGADGAEGVAIFSPLVGDFEVFCASARSFGHTTNTTTGTAQMVYDAIALLSVFAPNGEKVFMVAHSMGATVAPRVAKAHPESVAGLVLEDPGWLRREGEAAGENAPGTKPEHGDALSNESVENIQVPTLVLIAEYGDGVPEVIAAALASYPLGLKYVFPNATHCIHCDFPDKYRQVVRQYFYGLLGAQQSGPL